jgi:uncharacterized damage-inducible protein DinB
MNHSQATPSPGDQSQQDFLLRDACSGCVGQCLEVVRSLPVATYRHCLPGGSSIGTHMRHIIERIACVLDGQEHGVVDYDCRARDRLLESNPETATSALEAIQDTLATLEAGATVALEVRESVQQENPAVAVASTLERELMSLISHTIHHLAIIALLSRGAGHPLRDDIGKAPSTLIYERQSS